MKKLLSYILAAATALSAMQIGVCAQRYTSVPSGFSLDFNAQNDGESPAGLKVVNQSAAVSELDGEKCLKIQTTATGSNKSNVHILNENSVVNAATADGAIVVSARYYFPEALSGNRKLTVDLVSDSARNQLFVPFNFYNDKIYRGSSTTDALCEYPVGEWFTIKYTVIPSQAGTADSCGIMEMIHNGETTVLYNQPLSEVNVPAGFPNNALSIWQHDLIVQNTNTGDAQADSVCYYIDDMKIESVKQTTMLDVDFDDEYYRDGKSPSRVSFKNDSVGLNITVADMGGEHGNTLKCTSVRGAFRNTNNLASAVSQEMGNAWMYEYDLLREQALPAGKSIFPMFYTGEATTQPSAYAFAPYCICGDTIFTQIGGKGEALAKYPVGEWFKMRLVYAFADTRANDTVSLQMIDAKGNVSELYRKKKSELTGYITYNGTAFPNAGVGKMIMTVDDNTAGNTYYFDNFKMCSFDVPSVENLKINGLLRAGSKLSADYTFNAPDGGSDESEIVWYRGSNVADGVNTSKTEIARATKEYTITEQDCGKYVFCEVTPISSNGTRAFTAASAEVTVPEIIYDFENASQITSSFSVGTAISASVQAVQIDGKNAAAIIPDSGVPGVRGLSLQNKYAFEGLCGGTIIYSADIYLPGTMADGSSALMQFFTVPTSIAGKYLNAYWIKNNKLYAADGVTEIYSIPQDEWITVESVILVRDEKHFMVTLAGRKDGTKSVVDKREITLGGIDTDGFRYARLSYSATDGDDTILYIDNVSLKNELASGVYNAEAVQDGNNVLYRAKLVDYTYSKGILILKDNAGSDFKVTITELDNMKPEDDVEIVMENAVLGDGFRAYIWDSAENLKPVISDR